MNLPKPHKAQRQQSKAAIVVEGLAGSGKSGVALLIAKALAKGYDGIWCVDTENKSLDLFEGITLSDGEKCEPFTKVDLLPEHGYAPSTFLALREQAISDGAKVFVQDSTSHAWVGQDGVLALVGKLEEENSKLNKFNAWGNPTVVDEKTGLTSMIRDSRIHVISTVRLKEKFDLIPGEGVKSRGECQIMQADMKYEPDLLLRTVKPGTPDGQPPVVEVMKTRYAFLRLGQQYELTKDLLQQLVDYLDEGVTPEVLEKQQAEGLVVSITDVLKNNKVKQMSYKMWRNNNKIPEDYKLTDFSLEQLQTLYRQLTSN